MIRGHEVAIVVANGGSLMVLGAVTTALSGEGVAGECGRFGIVQGMGGEYEEA